MNDLAAYLLCFYLSLHQAVTIDFDGDELLVAQITPLIAYNWYPQKQST